MTSDDDVVRLYRRNGPPEGEPVDLPTLPALDRAGALAQFLQSLDQQTTPETSAQDNLGSLAIVYAAIESAATGEPVPHRKPAQVVTGYPLARCWQRTGVSPQRRWGLSAFLL